VRTNGLPRESRALHPLPSCRDERAREADAASAKSNAQWLQAERPSQRIGHNSGRQGARLTARSAAAEARLDGIAQRLVEARVATIALAAERGKLTDELADCLAPQTGARAQRGTARLKQSPTQASAEELELEARRPTRPHAWRGERGVDPVKNELAPKRNRLRALEDLHRL